MKKYSLLILVAGGLLAASSGLAELVVFQEGRVVKANSYRVIGDQLEIGLAGGGSYLVDLDRVERIVDDEVAVPDVVVQEAGGAPHPTTTCPTARTASLSSTRRTTA